MGRRAQAESEDTVAVLDPHEWAAEISGNGLLARGHGRYRQQGLRFHIDDDLVGLVDPGHMQVQVQVRFLGGLGVEVLGSERI